jgi:antitoxin component of MazEF toxin-antitoxin module
MNNQHVMTLESPAGLLITPELLEQIGVSTGDQIKISVSERKLIVSPLAVAETERKTATSKDTEAADDKSTVTIREIISEVLVAMNVESAAAFEVTLADGRKLLFHYEDDPRLDEVVKRADIKVKPVYSARGGGLTVDDSMKSIMDRYDNLFRRLAEGEK